MPNGFAYVVLLSWPLVAILIFRALPIPKAIAWTIVAGYLLLPERTGFDLPVLPTIDKTFVPAASAAVMSLLLYQSQARTGDLHRQWRGGRLIWGLIALGGLTPFITVLTNSEPVIIGRGVLFIPGLRIYDSLAMANSFLAHLLPFLLGWRFLATERDHAALLRVFAVAGLAYSLPILIEVRLSPQLSNWIYGFFPHLFEQHIRGDGFRPIVFLNHGLWVAIFVVMAVLAAAGLWRAVPAPSRSLVWLFATLYLFAVLIVVKSLGALLLVLFLLPILLFLGPRRHIAVAAVLAAIVLVYPMLRGAGLVPVEQIESLAASVSAERAESFRFRLDNEDILLDRANLKPLAGWGGWGRDRVFDPETGRDVSTTDGAWIIILGAGGWLGYVGQFGLLTLPVILIWRRRKTLGEAGATFALAVVLSVNLVDLLPNGTLTPLTWLLAGALLAQVEQGETERSRPSQAPQAARRSRAVIGALNREAGRRD